MMDFYGFAGHQVAFRLAGAGRPVVFLHNGGASHAIWRHASAALSGRFETLALDLLGYGASARPGSGYTLDNYVDMLAALVDGRRMAPVSLVGNCMGSAIALRFAEQRPASVRALVLINPLTAATFAAGTFGSALRLRRRVPRLARVIQAALARAPVPGWAARRVVDLQLGRGSHGLPERDADTLCACYAAEGQMTSLLGVFEDMGSYTALDAIAPGPDFPPICTVWGTDNRVLSSEAGRALNRKLRPARELWLDGCGHLPMLERPDEVSAAIGGFLEEVCRDAVSR